MPIYEYRCKQCRNEFEALVWSERDERTICCPQCQGKDLGRILSPFCTSSGADGLASASSLCGPSSSKFS
ncbi:FmdB family zinc ribbon protein [Desulfoferrobacter suflitae]|uniref:FmdB family zinc ribbon protein n=1 Tax=Desulfoferrobacter suflitae TaxID=2865782 RepID=UPI00338D7680